MDPLGKVLHDWLAGTLFSWEARVRRAEAEARRHGVGVVAIYWEDGSRDVAPNRNVPAGTCLLVRLDRMERGPACE